MKNPFSHSQKEEREEQSEKIANLSVADLEKRTAAIEAEREEKRFAREEKKFHKDQSQKRKQRERWIAPILLVLTVIISFLLYWKFQ